jgi:hypothetical protein
MDLYPAGTTFNNNIRTLENGIRAQYEASSNAANLINVLGVNGYDAIVDEICTLFGSGPAAEQAKNLFRARLAAHQANSEMKQREQATSQDVINNTNFVNARYTEIDALRTDGKTMNTETDKARAVLADLIENLPAGMGAGRLQLIRQLEDWARFQGYVKDAQQLKQISSAEMQSSVRLAQFTIEEPELYPFG